ncbi:MAG TPA: DUF4129 domain-containing protein, partial [Anaerolineales bacterium]|nr:DUF4129 domain-containing protein [Anaerolineales bacterium]
MNQSPNFNVIGNPKAFQFISYTLVFLMLTCFAMIIGILIQSAVPGWPSDIIAGITLFIIMERLYTYKRMKSLMPFSREWAITLGTQWVVIVLFIKALLSYTNDFDALVRDISSFTRGYLANLFDLEFVVTLLLAVLVWHISGLFLVLLDELGLDQKSALSEALAPGQGHVMTAHQRLVHLTLQLGLGLVILTALTRIHLNSLYNADGTLKGLNHFSGAEAGALLYFIFGFALLSLTRLLSLQTSWNRQHIPIASNNLVRQWGVYSVFFLLILSVVVGLLSSGYNLGLFSLLRIVFDFLIRIVLFIGQLIFILLALIFSIPYILFGKNLPVRYISRPPTPTPLPPNPWAESLPTDNPILALMRSILLWGALLVIVGFSVARFARQHGGFQATLRKLPIASWMFFVWQWLSNNADKARRTLSRTIADAWHSIVSRSDGKRLFPRPNLIRLSALDPRRQIYFFYLAMIRRGSEQGVERRSSQTPSEYAITLESALPSVNEDVRSMTEAFVEARYSPRKISSEEANLVKAA